MSSDIEGIKSYPLSIKDETIALAHGIKVETVRRLRAPLLRAKERREVAHLKSMANRKNAPGGNSDFESRKYEAMMRKGSAELEVAIKATEFYRSH